MKIFKRLVDGPGRSRGRAAPFEQSGQARAVIAQGWNGLQWGASLDDFRAKFPDAHMNDTWWVTGQGPESFCGVVMDTQYAFNHMDEMYLVAFYPKPEDRPQLAPAAVNHLGAPDGMDTTWTAGDVRVEVKTAGIVATITHTS
jgi:hypothetical protein